MAAPLTAGELREQVYVDLLRARAVAYPNPPFGHHPNFVGAADAAALLLEYLLGWRLRAGTAVLSYPDYVLRPLRRGLLERGVSVVVPAKHGKGYRHLVSGRVDAAKASSIAGAEAEGEWLAELPALRACLVACVALSPDGHHLGKGYGFAPPEEAAHLPRFALAHPLMVRAELPEPEGVLAAYATPQGVTVTAR